MSKNKRIYIWERQDWPNLELRMDPLAQPLASARRSQGELLGMVKMIGSLARRETAVAAMSREVVANSAIEGIDLSPEAVRESMLLRLGAARGGLPPIQSRRTDPIVEVLTEAVQGWSEPLTLERIFAWHRSIFPGGYSPHLGPIRVGAFRGSEPMVVASQPRRAGEPEIIHFQAPGRERLEAEMDRFLAWFEGQPDGMDGLVRAGLAHLWFVTIHPLEDGNGRIARTITDLALARDERSGLRFYSLSAQIVRNRSAYYDALEQAQRGPADVTPWMLWFLGQVREAAEAGMAETWRVLARKRLWAAAMRHGLNERQVQALRRALSPFNAGDTLSNRYYRKLTQADRTAATRELGQLADLGLLERTGQGRGVSYTVPLDRFRPDTLEDGFKD